MPKTANLKKSSRTNMLIALGIALGVSIVAYLLYSTFAAGPVVSVEPEAGIAATSKAKSIDDPAASGGKALQFAGVAPGPGEEEPTPPPSGDPGEVLMDGGFETGNTDSPYQYQHGDVSIVTSPVREGEYAAKFSGGAGGGSRAQLDRPFTFKDGDEYYIGFSTFFPNDFQSPPSWALFFQLHGPPYSGSPPISLVMGDGDNQLKLVSHNPNSSGREVHWTAPIVKDRWTDFTMRVKFSESSNGFVELWMNGQAQTLSDGSKRLVRSTMIDRYELYPTLTAYMGAGSATIYHDALKVGTTYQSVQPR